MVKLGVKRPENSVKGIACERAVDFLKKNQKNTNTERSIFVFSFAVFMKLSFNWLFDCILGFVFNHCWHLLVVHIFVLLWYLTLTIGWDLIVNWLPISIIGTPLKVWERGRRDWEIYHINHIAYKDKRSYAFSSLYSKIQVNKVLNLYRLNILSLTRK